MRLEAKARLHDALEACRTIREFVAGRTVEDYLREKMLRQAIERNFEILGEALNAAMKHEPSLATSIRSARQAIDFRNLLIHGYAIVKHEVVWQTIHEDVPELEQDLLSLLAKK